MFLVGKHEFHLLCGVLLDVLRLFVENRLLIVVLITVIGDELQMTIKVERRRDVMLMD